MTGKMGKLERLRADPQVGRWLRNLARGSPITAEGMGRKLSRVCELLSSDPRGLVAWAGGDLAGFQDALEDLVTRLEDEGKSPGTIVGFLKAVRSWLRYHDIVLTRRIKVSSPSATPTIEDEQIPSKEELSRIFRASKPRVRAAEALMAFADLRPQTLGNHDGRDGLTLRDLPEMRVEGDEVAFERVPAMIVVRSTLSKARHRYFTFLTGEGCTYLKEYLEQRLRAGERLGPESPLIGHERPRASTARFLLTRKVSHMIRMAMRRAGVYKRPYVLRCYAETQLIIAESRGKISHPYLQFVAGHKGDIEARYSTNKGILPPDMIEDMRRSFTDCEEYLSTRPPSREKDPELTTIRTMVESGVLDLSKPNVRRYLVNKLGIENAESRIAEMKEEGLGEAEAYARVVCRELGIKPMPKIEVPKKDRDPKKIVSERELEPYLAEGWNVQTVLPSGKILITK